MAIDLYLGHDGDLTDDVRLTTPAEGIRQNVEIALRVWRGEWILDRSHGTPYLEDVLHKRNYMQVARAAIVDRVMSCDGVLSVKTIDLKIIDRALTVNLEILTSYEVLNLAFRL